MLSILCVSALLISGCTSPVDELFLPSELDRVHSEWTSFAEAKAAFDQIVPEKTPTENLALLGFDPYSTPNVEILSYVQIAALFASHQAVRSVDPAVQSCIAAADGCIAYRMAPVERHDDSHGNVPLNLFGFRRQNRVTGWSFEAVILILDGEIVHKVWKGVPSVLEHRDRIRPLGPFQDLDLSVRDLL